MISKLAAIIFSGFPESAIYKILSSGENASPLGLSHKSKAISIILDFGSNLKTKLPSKSDSLLLPSLSESIP